MYRSDIRDCDEELRCMKAKHNFHLALLKRGKMSLTWFGRTDAEKNAKIKLFRIWILSKSQISSDPGPYLAFNKKLVNLLFEILTLSA